MDNNLNTEFNSLIKDLGTLKKIRAGKELKYRIGHMLLPNLPERKKYLFMPFTFLRPLAITVLILMFSGSGIVLASRSTRPGDFLYPVKAVVDGLFEKNEQKDKNPKVIISPTVIPVRNSKGTVPEWGLSPTEQSENDQQEIIIEIEAPVKEIIPTVTPVKNIVPTVKEILPTVLPKNPSPTTGSGPEQPEPTPASGILPTVKIILPIIGNLNIGL